MTLSPAVYTPRSVLWLGYGGLIPFIGLNYVVCSDANHAALWYDALRAYLRTLPTGCRKD